MAFGFFSLFSSSSLDREEEGKRRTKHCAREKSSEGRRRRRRNDPEQRRRNANNSTCCCFARKVEHLSSQNRARDDVHDRARVRANFLGIASLALRANEPLARKLKLDAVYEVSGYRRDRNEEKGYEFLFPNEYLADQTIARRNAMRKAQSLDLPSLRETKGQKNVGEPESAFGPMGTNGEENMSVIVQTSKKGFDLGQFGDAEEQASWLLENALARPGSGKEAKLFSASETIGENGIKYYQFEYTIKTANWYRRNVAVFAQNKNTGDVYTFVAQCPVERWDGMGEKFRKSANSFRVFTPKPPSF